MTEKKTNWLKRILLILLALVLVVIIAFFALFQGEIRTIWTIEQVEDLPLFFANNAGVLLEGGDGLFVDNAKGYIRLNLAMPRATIRTGLERMAEAIRKHNGK